MIELAAGTAPHVLEVTPDLACVRLSIVNAYLFGLTGAGDREWILIDAGLATSAAAIARAAAERFGPASRPAAILLTHGHFDHVGGLPALADRWDAPVYVHELEMPYVTGQSSYPPPDPAVGGGAMALLSRFYPRGPIDLGARVRILPADYSVPGMPGWRWLHTPGHTPGHVSFFRDGDRALVAGDAFVTTKQESAVAALVQPQQVSRPPAYYTCDWDAARRSVAMLARLEPQVAATGHGVPMAGDYMRKQLNQLLINWDRDARPSHGRYADRPAVTDARGVRSVPPPVVDRQLLALLAGLGVTVAAGLWLARHKSDEQTALT